ncbi:radical SAM/SPASM domain-containing protein [Flavobacterium sp. Root420]|uniref:radical SAM/SPASM domain-containing protein n=1 Tax=Flavobacterium sp. Root420 TaxID=1736533 RepID=UPI0006F4844B|nr:radical SAM protein [Flavobacterium sp. Root420]KQW98614.1 hypothetical protein ASC72_14025 [Flavobacterium sp. Root420]
MKLKLSHYTIITPIEDVIIVYSTRSNKTLILKREFQEFLDHAEFDKLPAAVLEELINDEIVISFNDDELHEIIKQNNDYIKDDTTLYQIIQPSANCQLGCGYCGQVHTKNQLEIENYELLVNRLDYKLSQNKQLTQLHIGWFGGEPLMGIQSIRELSVKFQKLSSKYNIDYSAKMVTNGLALKKNLFLELVTKYNVKSFEVTLDGIAEYHDKRRFVKSGSKSFDLIMNNLTDIFGIENFNDLGVQISIRCNVDKTNYESVTPLIELLRAKNFHDKISSFYVAPIHSWGNEAHLVSLEKIEFADKEIGWLIDLYKNDFNPWIMPSRNKQVCIIVNPNSELIDANGDIFNCTEISYVPSYEGSEYVLGNIKNIAHDHEFENKPLLNWNETILKGETELPCPTCKMLPVCGGQCPKSWKEGIVACPPSKFNIEDKLALSYLISEKGIDFLKIN